MIEGSYSSKIVCLYEGYTRGIISRSTNPIVLAEKRLQSTAYEFRYVKVRVMDHLFESSYATV